MRWAGTETASCDVHCVCVHVHAPVMMCSVFVCMPLASPRRRAYSKVSVQPNAYFYSYTAPGEKQKVGAWTKSEHSSFQSLIHAAGGWCVCVCVCVCVRARACQARPHTRAHRSSDLRGMRSSPHPIPAQCVTMCDNVWASLRLSKPRRPGFFFIFFSNPLQKKEQATLSMYVYYWRICLFFFFCSLSFL